MPNSECARIICDVNNEFSVAGLDWMSLRRLTLNGYIYMYFFFYDISWIGKLSSMDFLTRLALRISATFSAAPMLFVCPR